jgi:serine/threonine protein kinase
MPRFSFSLLLHSGTNVWIVMEYCAAGSLSDIMQICNRTFSEAQVAAIMKHSLHGLAYLHAQKKIHRDIKGGNVLVDSFGRCKLGQ